MKSLLSNMNLARWIMLTSLLLSLVLAVTGYTLHQRRTELEDALAGRVPRTTQEIQNLALRYTALRAEADRVGLTGQNDPMTYLAGLASMDKVALGNVDLRNPPSTTPRKGVVDEKYTIRSADDRAVVRTKIANYMYRIEEKSRRMRVTGVNISREGSLKPWEYGNDRWKWNLEVTSRQKVEP